MIGHDIPGDGQAGDFRSVHAAARATGLVKARREVNFERQRPSSLGAVSLSRSQ